jgi:hypothetical protein
MHQHVSQHQGRRDTNENLRCLTSAKSPWRSRRCGTAWKLRRRPDSHPRSSERLARRWPSLKRDGYLTVTLLAAETSNMTDPAAVSESS